jgi:hypothetical protein
MYRLILSVYLAGLLLILSPAFAKEEARRIESKDLLRQNDESKEDATRRLKEKYDGKRVEFSGVVVESEPDDSNGLYRTVLMASAGASRQEKGLGVIVYFGRNAGGTRRHAVGSVLTVEGDAKVGDEFVLQNCTLLSSSNPRTRPRK